MKKMNTKLIERAKEAARGPGAFSLDAMRHLLEDLIAELEGSEEEKAKFFTTLTTEFEMVALQHFFDNMAEDVLPDKHRSIVCDYMMAHAVELATIFEVLARVAEEDKGLRPGKDRDNERR